MLKTSKPVLVITCDEPPRPPLVGNNRKVHDVIWMLAEDYELHIVVYPKDETDLSVLRHYWRDTDVQIHPLQRRRAVRHLRAITQQLSLPTVTRDFAAELRLVRQVHTSSPGARVLIDLISGSPLCRHLRGGVLVSGHDCMSYFWRCMATWSTGIGGKLHSLVRRQFALQAERLFYHLAHRVHVVSSLDATELARVNPAVHCVVIPISGRLADPAKLRPPTERCGGLFWGNLAFPPIAAGLKRFLAAASRKGLTLEGWKLLGGVPAEQAEQSFPEFRSLGLEYLSRVEDLAGLLGSVRFLALTDLAGAGQKHRCLDGLAHGCCVIGLDEVFRDFPGASGHDFIRLGSPEEMASRLPELVASDTSVIGTAGQALFRQHFSMDTLRYRWREAIAELPPLGFAKV